MHDKINGTDLPSVMALAYLGDARHSLFVRAKIVSLGISKSGELNETAQRHVTAEAQARAMTAVEPLLLPDEAEVYKRAFNSTHLNRPKHAKGREYRAATGFEAVVGMLEWLGDTDRLNLILEKAYMEIEKNDTED